MTPHFTCNYSYSCSLTDKSMNLYLRVHLNKMFLHEERISYGITIQRHSEVYNLLSFSISIFFLMSVVSPSVSLIIPLLLSLYVYSSLSISHSPSRLSFPVFLSLCLFLLSYPLSLPLSLFLPPSQSVLHMLQPAKVF